MRADRAQAEIATSCGVFSDNGWVVEIVLLGTGTPLPDRERCGSGVAVTADAGWVLVDCGRGVTQRAMQAGLDLAAVAAVLLTHHHSDHVSDLATFATTRWTAGGRGPLVVFAPNGPCSRFAQQCLDTFEDQAFYSQAAPDAGRRPGIHVRAFDAIGELTTVFDEGGWEISSVLVDHHPIEAAVGYRVRCGGHVVAISGDTAVAEGCRRLAESADVLVHEAALSDSVPPALLTWNASARSVGELAAHASVRTTILTHLLLPPSTPQDEQAFLDEARAGGYRGELHVARDLMRLPLT